jgi:hypothetical protein
MSPLRYLLVVVALLVLCGASRGTEFKRMPVGPVAPELNFEQPVSEVGSPAITIQVGVTGPKDRNEATKKDVPGRKDDSQRNFPRLRRFVGRFRSQG